MTTAKGPAGILIPVPADLIQAAVARFEAAWHSGARPPLADFVPAEGGHRRAVLMALVHTDLEHRLKAGEPARVEAYLDQYPDLGADPAAVVDLISTEYKLRRRQEPNLTPEDYQQRFPGFVEQVNQALTGQLPWPALVSASINTRHESLQDSLLGPRGHPAISVLDGATLANYEILEELGRGGMGVVYRAYDRKRGIPVALKTLPQLTPEALYHFKNEFRALAGVTHPNLVSLYELIAEGRQWFFAMEFIDGSDFLSYVRGDDGVSRERTQADWAFTRAAERALPGTAEPGRSAPVNEDRLREALRQLALGVQAVHDAGRLHRDLKPSNVLVTPAGRVVILDFGLVTELDPGGSHPADEGGITGTVGYMAPEQAAGLPLSPASDWYSVGTMLYQALTGQPPFRGATQRVLKDKQTKDPPWPAELVASVPADLNSLCIALLQRPPERRPLGREVLRQLGESPAARAAVGSAGPLLSSGLPFVGRERQLQALADAYRMVQAGQTMVVTLQGRSGVGKSALVQRFLEAMAAGGEAVILAGRCYEHESVPYKAVDSVVDALTRYLRRLPVEETEALLPPEVLHLARLFPVLRSVDAVARTRGGSAASSDPHELRRRAFAALRALLARLGSRQPLVLAIDDLQWGDIDSAALLTELLRPPNPPVVLLLGSFRSEDTTTSPFLNVFLASEVMTRAAFPRQDLVVEPLTPAETRALGLRLLGRDDPEAQALVEPIVRESGGSPFFIAELVQHLRTSGDPVAAPAASPALSLDRVLWERIGRLPADARQLLEIAAVHGRPLRQSEAWKATCLSTDERPALAVLCSGRLLRSTGATERDEIETYHDRVRETVVAHLGPMIRAKWHGSLARTLEAAGEVEPEVLAIHFHGAGESGRASRYYAVAAAQAAEALAFDRAAKLYRLALDLGTHQPTEERRLRTDLGNALTNAGRGAEAAEAYLAAVAGSAPAEALDLQRRAAEQLLTSGRVDEGCAMLRIILAKVGLGLARTPRQAFWSLLVHRARLVLRGLRFRERPADQVPADDLARIDIGWAASLGLSMTDNIRSADIQTRHLLLALRAGEPSRIARALVMEVPHTAGHGGARMKRRAAHLVDTSESIARRLGDPYLIGIATLARGVADYLTECWQPGLELIDQADRMLREHCTGVAWEMATAHVFALWSLMHLGQAAELARRCPALLREAQQRGDLYAATNMLSFTPLVWLMADNPASARQDVEQALAQWTHHGYHIQHYALLQAQVAVELYTGNGGAAWDLASTQWPAFAGSFLKRVQLFHVCVRQLHAYSALAAAATAPQPRPLLRAAEAISHRLWRAKTPWSTAAALYVRGAAAAIRGQRSDARAALGDTAARFDAAGMRLHAAAVRRRLGELDGDRAAIAGADAVMAGQNIQKPARMVAVYAPGFPVRE